MEFFSRTATGAPVRAAYGLGTGSIWLDELECTGREETLFDCSHGGVGIQDCSHFEDASAECAGTVIK